DFGTAARGRTGRLSMYRLSARISSEATSRRSRMETAGEAAGVRVWESLGQPAIVRNAAVLFAGRCPSRDGDRVRTDSSREDRSENQTERLTRYLGTGSRTFSVAAADTRAYAHPQANLRLCRDARGNR